MQNKRCKNVEVERIEKELFKSGVNLSSHLAAALRPYATLYAIASVFTLKREISTKTTAVAKREKKKVRMDQVKMSIYLKANHIAINEVVTFEFGISPAKNTRISKAQYSKLHK